MPPTRVLSLAYLCSVLFLQDSSGSCFDFFHIYKELERHMNHTKNFAQQRRIFRP